RMISIEDVLRLHELSIKFFGGSSGVRDMDMLESALARPFQTFGGVELYESIFEKSAALLESLVKNHPFVDGNKRTGFLAVLMLLKKSKIKLIATEAAAYDFVINVASSQIAFEEIILWLKENSTQSQL
ncbi:MAG TPA: type II toxin-antitoxin system death-on-curing family toxin, partial [Panacibacter sp.]|nr:type II toxin-antitoxin system death-on-curing family toxin [Panacibacter sp.]